LVCGRDVSLPSIANKVSCADLGSLDSDPDQTQERARRCGLEECPSDRTDGRTRECSIADLPGTIPHETREERP